MEKVHPNYREYRKIFDQVVRDILDGKLEHDQTDWHCGTAHCVRGWFEVKATKHFYNQDYDPISEKFVDATDKTYHKWPVIFTAFYKTGLITNTEICSYLTGYDVYVLMNMFIGDNTHDDIREYAQELGIDLSPQARSTPDRASLTPQKENELVRSLNNVKNHKPQVVRVTSIS